MPNSKFAELDQLFSEVWIKTQDIPETLSIWQKKLQETLDDSNATPEELTELELLMGHWKKTLGENRSLLEAHQSDIIEQIKKGTPSFLQNKQVKKFKK